LAAPVGGIILLIYAGAVSALAFNLTPTRDVL